MKTKGKITPKSYELAKRLLEAEVKKSEIARIIKVNPATIYRISKSNTLEEYRETARLEFLKYHKQPSKPEVVEDNCQEESPSTPIYDVLIEIRDEIKTINAYISKAGGRGIFRW